ncbi:MAG: hypothetical protein LBL16_03680 [Endomicrobium sp.]|nr:hypothetical protein [Endomicrobium sp.]
MFFVVLKVNGQEVEVSSSPQTISLSTLAIVFASNYNHIGVGLKTIRGNNGVLDGRMNHVGFRFGSGTGCGDYLSISDVTMQNFSSHNDRRKESNTKKNKIRKEKR